MKKLIAGFACASALAISAFGADVTAYVIDKNCASKKEMLGNEACATRCIGRGAAAVLATEDGKIYTVTNQEKIKDFAGKKVTVSGKMEGDSITVDTVKAST
jgi:hypothetical protein